MLKKVSNFVLSRSAASTYSALYASAAELLAASLENLFEHPHGKLGD
jgi:hypothetical protein